MKTADLIDQARSCAGIPSDYALAKRLGVTRQVVSGWRTGYAYPNNLLTFSLARLAQRDPGQVIAEIEQERADLAGKAEQVSAWRELLTKPASIAASVVFAFSMSTSPDADAGVIAPNIQTADIGCLYIMLTKIAATKPAGLCRPCGNRLALPTSQAEPANGAPQGLWCTGDTKHA